MCDVSPAERKTVALQRLCLDPEPLNAVILRECYVVSTPADVQSKLSGKQHFSVINVKGRYRRTLLRNPRM